MNTIKTIVVVATLLGVSYGAHVVLNKPIPNRFSTDDTVWQDVQHSPPQIDFTAMNDARPQIELPDLQPTPLDSVRTQVGQANNLPSVLPRTQAGSSEAPNHACVPRHFTRRLSRQSGRAD